MVNHGLGKKEKFYKYLLDLRAGFGDGQRVITVARDAELRSPINWTLPGLGIFFGACLLLFNNVKILESMPFRVFILDYCIFAFGLLSGWNMARRWRSNADQVEEISLTPLLPGVVGNMFTCGQVAIWLGLFCLFAVLDFLTPFAHINAGTTFLARSGIDELSVTGFVVGAVTLVAHAALVILLAWFHFESVRLAHWMFAIHSLPRISLMKAGIKNFVAMTGFVVGLSILGSMITGLMIFLLVLLVAILSTFGGYDPFSAVFSSYTAWGIAAIPGLIVVTLLKRLLVRSYERSFVRAWLQYQWWGAGESRQPKAYPAYYQAALPMWESYFGSLEEESAGVAPHMRSNTARYRAHVEKLRQEGARSVVAPQVSGDKNSGFPSPAPGPHSEP